MHFLATFYTLALDPNSDITFHHIPHTLILQFQGGILLHEQISQQSVIFQPLREHERLLRPLLAQGIVFLQVVINCVVECCGR